MHLVKTWNVTVEGHKAKDRSNGSNQLLQRWHLIHPVDTVCNSNIMVLADPTNVYGMPPAKLETVFCPLVGSTPFQQVSGRVISLSPQQNHLRRSKSPANDTESICTDVRTYVRTYTMKEIIHSSAGNETCRHNYYCWRLAVHQQWASRVVPTPARTQC